MPGTESILKLLEFATALVGLVTGCVELYKTGRPDTDAAAAARKRRVRVVILTLSFVLILGITGYTAFSKYFLYTSLELHDPAVFHAGPHDYRVARVFPDRTKLRDEGGFEAILIDTKNDFEIDTISAHELLGNYSQAIENTLARGVEMRFLLFDASDANRENCKSYAASTNQNCASLKQNLKDSLNALRKIHTAVPNGRLEVKLCPTVSLKSFWIKDRSAPDDSVVQVEFHDVKADRRASFRVGRLDNGSVLERNLADLFNEQWTDKQTQSVLLVSGTAQNPL